MTAAPWMPLYPRDYIADTTHLTRDEDGGYFLLLMAMWLRGGALPDDDRQLAHITKCATKSEWKKLRAQLEMFFEISDGVWRQKRLEFEYEKSSRRSEAQSLGAQLANAKRGANRTVGDPVSETLSDTVTAFTRAEGSLPQPQPQLFETQEGFSPRARSRARKPGILETQMKGFADAARSEPRRNGRDSGAVAQPLLDRRRTGTGPAGDC